MGLEHHHLLASFQKVLVVVLPLGKLGEVLGGVNDAQDI